MNYRIQYRITRDPDRFLPRGVKPFDLVTVPVPSPSIADRMFASLVGHYLVEPFTLVMAEKYRNRWVPLDPETPWELVKKET